MVFHKRLEYGFNGYQVPPTPRAARSARKRRTFKRKADDGKLCAFDLLAAVAGKLLLEGESSLNCGDTHIVKGQSETLNSSIKTEQLDEEKTPNAKSTDQVAGDQSFFVAEDPILGGNLKNIPHALTDACSGPASGITSSECSEKVRSDEQLANDEFKLGLGSCTRKVDVGSSAFRVSNSCKLESESQNQIDIAPANAAQVLVDNKADIRSSDCATAWDKKSSVLGSSDYSVKFPRDHNPCGPLPVNRDDVKLVSRDDDENSSGCTQPSAMNKAFRPASRIGDRRIRKLLASKYWKVTPNRKARERFNADTETRHIYHIKRNGFKRQRSQRDYPFKKRRLYGYSSVSNSDSAVSNDGRCSSPRNYISGDSTGSLPTLAGVYGAPSSIAGGHASFQTRDAHVKLKIKSFRIPELLIEMPESATVGSLKRTVMEAVTAILSDGLHVGVLLQGKKIKDDNKTLLQTGISHDNKLDALGFTLEPKTSQALPSLCREDHPYLLPCDPPQPIQRYRPDPSSVHSVVQQGASETLHHPGTNLSNFIESDHDSAPSPPDISLEKGASDSKALVPVPTVNMEALAVVPIRKTKRSDAAQRRIRRPFSVAEVEALVQAVEKLGTGRWRDVKLRAFENAKHRTYVDLKDKWKTLVHTARISPQQRRGEPVPQELLDRVLTAHAYWSQQQTKQQLKQSETCLLL